MRVSPVLRWAVLASVLAHLFLMLPLFSLAWLVAEPEETRIEAHLLPPPTPAPKAPRKKPARKAPPPQAGGTHAATPAAAADPLVPVPSEPAPPEVPTIALPGEGRIVFQVSHGENRFPLGRATHHWSIEGARYKINSRIVATGIVALFADIQLAQSSSGTINAQGLVPETFVDQRKGKEYTARFAWSVGRLFLGEGGSENRELPLLSGAQDLLSMMYQFALLPLDGEALDVPVTNGRKLVNYRFTNEEDEVTLLDGSTLAAFHLRYRGTDGEGVDVWLARDYARLPVRILYLDRKGGITELLATAIKDQGQK